MDDKSIFDIYPNWHSDTRIGPLNVADDEKSGDDVLVIPDAIELKLAEREALAKTGTAVGAGVVAGTLGAAGELESLGRGAIENLKQKHTTFMQTMSELSNTLGMEKMSNMLTSMYGEEKRGGIQAFLEGLNQETFFPKMEEIEQKIIDTGIELPDGDMEGLRDGLMILGELFSGEQLFIKGKDVIKDVGTKLSKGVDSAKKFEMPRTVYHGTDKQFDTFNNASGGIYFTDNPEMAKRFGKNMKEVELKLENPYVIDNFSFDSGMGEKFELWKNKIKRKLGSKDYGRTTKSNAWSVDPDTIKRLQDKGYDGIAIPSSVSSSGDNRYIVFDASQITIKGKAK